VVTFSVQRLSTNTCFHNKRLTVVSLGYVFGITGDLCHGAGMTAPKSLTVQLAAEAVTGVVRAELCSWLQQLLLLWKTSKKSGVGCQGQQLSKAVLGNCWIKSGNSPLSCFCASQSYLLSTPMIVSVFYYYSEFISNSVACPQTCKLTQTARNHRQLASSQNSYPKPGGSTNKQ